MSLQLSPKQFADAFVETIPSFPKYLENEYLRKYKGFDESFIIEKFPRFVNSKCEDILGEYKFSHPKTKKIVAKQFEQTANWIMNNQAEIKNSIILQNDIVLREPTATGIGGRALFYSLDEVGFRVSPYHYKRPIHPLMIPAIYTSRECWIKPQKKFSDYMKHFQMTHSTIEVTPLADCSQTTQKDVDDLTMLTWRTKLDYFDNRIENQGLYQAKHWRKARQVVVDPEAAQKHWVFLPCFK